MVQQFVNSEPLKLKTNHKLIEFDIVSATFRHKAYLREPPILIKNTRLKRKHRFRDSMFVVKAQALADFSQNNEQKSPFVQQGETQP